MKRAKKAKVKKGRPANYTLITTKDASYEVLHRALKWHDELASRGKVALAWRKNTKSDVDGHIVLGKCVKVSDLQKEFIHYDFIIVLNKEYWDQFNDAQRLALMDHELCHAQPAEDKECEQKEDERGRKLWRLRKHDIEEFREIVQRHGCYKLDLEKFAEALRAKNKAPLFQNGGVTDAAPLQ